MKCSVRTSPNPRNIVAINDARLQVSRSGNDIITSVRRIILLSTRDFVELTLRFLRNLFPFTCFVWEDLPTDSFHESSKRGSSLKFTAFFSSNSRYYNPQLPSSHQSSLLRPLYSGCRSSQTAAYLQVAMQASP